MFINVLAEKKTQQNQNKKNWKFNHVENDDLILNGF